MLFFNDFYVTYKTNIISQRWSGPTNKSILATSLNASIVTVKKGGRSPFGGTLCPLSRHCCDVYPQRPHPSIHHDLRNTHTTSFKIALPNWSLEMIFFKALIKPLVGQLRKFFFTCGDFRIGPCELYQQLLDNLIFVGESFDIQEVCTSCLNTSWSSQ